MLVLNILYQGLCYIIIYYSNFYAIILYPILETSLGYNALSY